LSHWNPYAVRIGSCLELYYCNMVGFQPDLNNKLVSSMLWHCWLGHLSCKNCPRNNLYVEWTVDVTRFYTSAIWSKWAQIFKKILYSLGFSGHCVLWPWPLSFWLQNLISTSMDPNTSVTRIGWNSLGLWDMLFT